jgi:hypothetical protein
MILLPFIFYPIDVWCHLVPPPILVYADYLTPRDISYSIFAGSIEI